MTCTCGHRAISHRYMVTIAANAGECLSPQCPCVELLTPADADKIDASLAACCDGHAKYGVCYNDPEDER